MSGHRGSKIIGRNLFDAEPLLVEFAPELISEFLWLLPELISYVLTGGV
ncbi:MAG: hypothetical protein HY237_12535 [Acidobacteria bacterium]|nr:hypothetical protein [Acidobacteriota bacterium]